MANKYYQPGQQRAGKVSDLFAAIAPRYDVINDLQSLWLHRRWKRYLVRLARPRRGERALDLCCGTGDIAFLLARSGTMVSGLDFSAAMLSIAGQRGPADLIKNGGPRPLFVMGDAQEIPFPDDSFDIVTIGYGLRNLSSLERGLKEMQRVARPGGRVLILDFGKPDNALWRAAYFGYLRAVVPVFGKVCCGDAQTHAYILESLLNYPAQRGIEARMHELHFANVRTINLLGGIMSINYGEKRAQARPR
jgi:demethylmenaquinone methyltransferase/2-methoxy-6-polyprenyl-1,4-benzoquinol methylase